MKTLIAASLLFSSMAYADFTVTGDGAQKLWKSIDTIGKIENVPVVQPYNGKEYMSIDTVSCVFEEYNACTFYANTDGQRNFVIAYDGAQKFQQALADVGVGVDEDEYRMDVVHVGCERDQANYTCEIVEYVRPVDAK